MENRETTIEEMNEAFEKALDRLRQLREEVREAINENREDLERLRGN